MILAGLTGGIASGKSVVSRCFKRLGAYLIDADVLAHQAIEPGTCAWEAIREKWGNRILKSDQAVDRQKLADVVFRDQGTREWLNSVVHPRVFLEQERLAKEITKRDPKAVIVFDAALLIETGAYERMDKVVVVTADQVTQLKRLIERDGFTREDAERRIASQAPTSEKERHADYLIDGTQSLEAIERNVAAVYKELKSLA